MTQMKHEAPEFLQLKNQLLEGVKNADEFNKAKQLFLLNTLQNQNNLELLIFLIDRGIFQKYASLYHSEYKKDIICLYPITIFLAIVLNADIFCCVVAMLAITCCVLKNEDQDKSVSQALFSNLSIIQRPDKRHLFLEVAVLYYEKNKKAYDETIDFIKTRTESDTQKRWLLLLKYVTNANFHFGKPFYSTILSLFNDTIFQNYLGFSKAHQFNFFAQQIGFPKEIYWNINKIMADLLVLDSCKPNWKP